MSKNREKFVELAEKRVSKAIKNLRLIGNLSNKTNYRYSDEDVKKIMTALENELKNLRKKFDSINPDQPIIFKL